MNKDLALGSATIALAAGYYAMAAAIPPTLLSDGVGPQRLPKTYAVLLAGLSLVLIVRSLSARIDTNRQVYTPRRCAGCPEQQSKGRTRPALPEIDRRTLWRVTGMLLIGMIYVVAVPWLGYVLSLAGLIMATTYYQGGVVNRQVLVVAVSGAIFFWILFVLVLGIPQPPGLWPSLL